jgi:hypothetical protein
MRPPPWESTTLITLFATVALSLCRTAFLVLALSRRPFLSGMFRSPRRSAFDISFSFFLFVQGNSLASTGETAISNGFFEFLYSSRFK